MKVICKEERFKDREGKDRVIYSFFYEDGRPAKGAYGLLDGRPFDLLTGTFCD